MRGRLRLLAIATLCVAPIAALSSSAGATDAPGTYNVTATGAVLTFNALGVLTISGAASSASAGSGKLSARPAGRRRRRRTARATLPPPAPGRCPR
jgi:hypothetical protein